MKPTQLLFEPFRYIAGGPALALGMLVLVVAALLSWHWGVSLASLQHVQYLEGPPYLHLLIGVINWLALLVFLWPAGLWLTPSSFRFIDLAGTLLLSRWPAALSVFALVPGPVREVAEAAVRSPRHMATFSEQIIWLGVSLISISLMLLSLWLGWRAFAISCNVRGPRAAVAYVAGMVAASLVTFFVNGWLIEPDMLARW